jgi:hypothetical protein
MISRGYRCVCRSTTHITLPNLLWFVFVGASAYLEMVLPRIATPLLENLQIGFFYQLTTPLPHLSQFMSSTQGIRFSRINLAFFRAHFTMRGYPHEGANMLAYTLWFQIQIFQLNRQVASVVRILKTLRTALSTWSISPSNVMRSRTRSPPPRTQ